jgi:radical SAM protein with 4Fe4S-binding SPASM domain
MLSLLPVRKNSQNPANPLWDNADRLKRIWYRLSAHSRLAATALIKGVPIRDIVVTRFPFILPDADLPPSMHVELTDACNLKCVYCNNPGFPYPRTVMNQQTLSSLLANLENFPVSRVCLGGGEPTLHPKFTVLVQEMRRRTKILTIVSNGQWKREEIASALVGNINMIEISVDAGGKDAYETSRPGADYARLMRNLLQLKECKKRSRSKTQINIRLMIRPSKLPLEKREKAFWRSYCDTIMPQYIMKLDDVGYDEDVFVSKYSDPQAFPKCSMPFKNMQVRANGSVYLCQVSGSAANPAKKLLLGNINASNLFQLWNSPVMKRYRLAHRTRNEAEMPVCKGCRGV